MGLKFRVRPYAIEKRSNMNKHLTVYSPIAVVLLAANLRLLCTRHPDGRSTTSRPQIQSEHKTTWSTSFFLLVL